MLEHNALHEILKDAGYGTALYVRDWKKNPFSSVKAKAL